MRQMLLTAATLCLTALPVTAEIVKVRAAHDVAITGDALQAAMDEAGATVFARIDHAGAAEMAGLTLAPETLFVFGNPQSGTPMMQEDPLAGLFLPLKVLVYQDGSGAVWLAYENPADTFAALKLAKSADTIAKMRGALEKLTAAAAAQ